MKNFLPYSRQLIDDDDHAAMLEVLRSDFDNRPKIGDLKRPLLQRLMLHVVACSSSTAGLHMATNAIELRPDDVAIVPAITFLSTANAVRFTGAEVVFADVDPDTGLITPETADAALVRAKNARAILPVHLNGQCCDMDTLKPWADQKSLFVIEDACHVLGGGYGDGNLVGSGSDNYCILWPPVKNIAMGEGGIVTTDNSDLFNK